MGIVLYTVLYAVWMLIIYDVSPGLEVASYLIGKASSVTLVGRQPEPLQAILGTKVGAMVRKVCHDVSTHSLNSISSLV